MKKRTGERAALLAGAVIAGSLGSGAPVLAASNEAQLEGEITAATGAAGVQTVTVTSNIALTGVLSNVTDALVLQPGVSLTASGGAAGAGHTGIAGNAGADAGLTMLTFTGADASLSNGAGSVIEGGTGGAGRGLTAADAQGDTSTTLSLDGTAGLAGQAGIAAGDSFDITINGVIRTITINAGETLDDIAQEIEAAFSPGQIAASATQTGTHDTLTILQGGGVIETLIITNNNNTPLTAMGFTGPFPRTIDPLFELGGAGGEGAVAIELGAAASGIFSNEGTITGGAGGNGGSTLFRDGDGGVGGNGAAAIVMQNGNTATLQNTGTISGGAGGVGGTGGVDGFDGAHGLGATGVIMSGNGQTLVNGGLIEGGLRWQRRGTRGCCADNGRQ